MADAPDAADADDYDALYRAHRGRVLRLCRLMLGHADDAEEVAQEVFLRLHRALRDGPPAASWGAWLTTVTVNACRDRRRSRWWQWFRRADALDELEIPDRGLGPEQAAVDRETGRRILAAFRSLPTRQREVFALRQLEGYSTEATSDLLGLSPGSVKQHLFRAIRHLRAALEEST